MIVHFEVTAPGVAEPDGTVLIKVGSRERTVTVKKGKAVARFVGVDPGRYRVRCQYAGSTLVEPGQRPRLGAGPGQGSVREGLSATAHLAPDTEEPAGRIPDDVRRASVVGGSDINPRRRRASCHKESATPVGPTPRRPYGDVRARLTLVGSTKR